MAMKVVEYLRDNPVYVMDAVKYILAALVLFGLPIPAGLDVLVAGLLVTVLTVVTRKLVTPNGKVAVRTNKMDD